MSGISPLQSNKYFKVLIPQRETGCILFSRFLNVLTTITVIRCLWSEAAQFRTIIKVISAVSSKEEGAINPFSIFAGWSLATLLSLESPQEFYYEGNMLLYYLACLFLLACSIFELQHQHLKQMKNADQKKTKTYKRKRWRKKKPFRIKDGPFHKRAQRRKSLKRLKQLEIPVQKQSLLQTLWKEQNSWFSHPDYFDLDDDGWFLNLLIVSCLVVISIFIIMLLSSIRSANSDLLLSIWFWAKEIHSCL